MAATVRNLSAFEGTRTHLITRTARESRSGVAESVTCDSAFTAFQGVVKTRRQGHGSIGKHVITNVETTPATTPDDNMIEVIHESLERRGLLPGEHLVDKGYTGSHVLVDSQ